MKQLFDSNKFYIIRSEKGGVAIGKIVHAEGTTIQLKSFRRLYYWNGALDVSMIAANGVAKNGNKFSVQLSEDDLSVMTNVIEFHPLSDKALLTINNVKPWKN